MKLSGQQRKELQEALIDAFVNKASLEQMLSYELEKSLETIAGDSNLQEITFKLIQAAEAEGWVEDLVRAARTSNPGNLNLQSIPFIRVRHKSDNNSNHNKKYAGFKKWNLSIIILI
jgi:hypothetical protein